MTELISIVSVHDTMNPNVLIEYSNGCNCSAMANPKQPRIDKLSQQNENLFSLLKMNFLIQEMIKLGGLENDNFAPILDLHQDIKLPEYDSIDLEAAGLPNDGTYI